MTRNRPFFVGSGKQKLVIIIQREFLHVFGGVSENKDGEQAIASTVSALLASVYDELLRVIHDSAATPARLKKLSRMSIRLRKLRSRRRDVGVGRYGGIDIWRDDTSSSSLSQFEVSSVSGS